MPLTSVIKLHHFSLVERHLFECGPANRQTKIEAPGQDAGPRQFAYASAHS
jgi:hypothetical protein